mgnify:FL=1|tara:strand:- start:4709 stop:4906 length:198 start_codon:yes stop_codon:yes gene_type:complete
MIIMKIRKISEIAYLVIFIIASYEYLFGTNIDQDRKNILLVFAVVSVFMFFFRRYFRKKFESRKK